MKFVATYSHHNAVGIWKAREQYEWITDVFEAPHIQIGAGSTNEIREHVERELVSEGWAFNVKVDVECDLTVFAKKDDLVIQLQTGNISRYAYDVLKLQHLYARREIDACALAVPTKECGTQIGSNIAYAERIWNELNIFDRLITVPIMIISFA